MLNLGKYAKLITALVGAAVVIIGRASGVGSTTYLDVVTVVTALGVYAVPNTGTSATVVSAAPTEVKVVDPPASGK